MLVTSTNFGDPCVGFKNKQMMIQYQCLDFKTYNRVKSCTRNLSRKPICPILLNTTNLYFEQKWCEPTTMSINCNWGFVINIICSFYGIDPNFKCESGYYNGSPNICYSDSFLQVNSTCSGRQNCSLNGNPSFEKYLINACNGYTNTLYIKWECVLNVFHNNLKQIDDYKPKICLHNDTHAPTGQCSNISKYEPEFLISPNVSNFEYPIYEKVICNGGKVVIKCLNSYFIHIFSAYYGIQFKTQTSCIHQTTEVPTKCYFPSAFTKLSQTCDYKNECEINATSTFFNSTNLCHNSKQLVIQYQCISSYALNIISKCSSNNQIPLICPELNQNDSTIHQNTWCSISNGTIIIKCRQNQTIDVICSFYGHHPYIKECSIPKDSPICYFNSSYEIVKKTCNGLNSCSIQLSSMQSCCIGSKTFQIQWRCK